MKSLILTAAILSLVPTLRAQQAETKENPPQAAPQEVTENPGAQNSLPPELRPGHPLDPADVDILTGKRDREIEACRRAIPFAAGGYCAYTSDFELNGRRMGGLELPLLPLQRINNPFFFYNRTFGGYASRGVRRTRRQGLKRSASY